MYSYATSGGKEEGMQMADNEKKEETVNQKSDMTGESTGGQTNIASGVATEYQFSKEAKLKECKYCRVMVPKKAKICPNCKMSLKKRWLRNFFIILILLVAVAAVVAGGYYYLYEYQPTRTASVDVTEQNTEVAEEKVVLEEDTVTEEATVTDEVNKNEENKQLVENEMDTEETVEMPDALAMLDEAEVTDDEEVSNEIESTDEIEGEVIELTECLLTEEDICGADGPILDYADEKSIIFHDYCGMFVYDIDAEEIVTAFDLAAIGCQDTQGDASCQVSVTEDGKTIYLHASNTKNMYVFDVEEKVLTKRAYSMKDTGKLYGPEITSECVEADPTLFRTFYCADLGKEKYLYLESGSGLIADMCYVVEEAGEVVECVNLFENYFVHSAEAGVENKNEKDKEKNAENNTEEYQELVNTDILSQISYKDMLRK